MTRRLAAACSLLWSLLAVFSVWRFGGWTVDDFYITYRYAENLARGLGLVYNPGERVFGVTDPGLAVLLGLLRCVTRIPVEWLASGLFAAALVAIALLLLREGHQNGRGMAAEMAAGGTLLVLSSLLWANNGAAAPLSLVLLLGAAAFADRRPGVAGLLAGLAVAIRPDAGIGVALLGLLLLHEKRRLPWKYGIAGAATILLAALLAGWWFGSPLPNTLGAKIEMAQAADVPAFGAQGFWTRAVLPLSRHFGPLWLLPVAVGLVGQWPLFQRSGRLGRLLVLQGAALAVLYPALGVPFFSWYILIPVIALLYGIAAFAGSVGRGIGREQRWLAGLAGALLLVLFLPGFARAALAGYRDFIPPPRLVAYREAAEWIRANSQPDEAIAYVEIGALGYWSERPIADLMGLVTPRVRPFLEKNDIAGGFLTGPTPWVVFHRRGRMAPIVQAGWFDRYYERVAEFEDGKLIVFRRNEVPAPALPLHRP
jgi:hypothetical protein